ncbi:MAG TPA: ribonuclease H-like domain-containing protein [Dehalococcoidia bacterium]|nr:ribonuclease H-like domain-containing protein [Dehalococcoidia bacterium]
MEAYLDIETTGLSAFSGAITVVGIYLCDNSDARFIQLVGRDITRYSLLETLEGVDTIYTYNGRRFDLPFINVQLGINLEELFNHRDLMYDCWRYNLRGGFKAVERQLGIPRELVEVDGRMAVRLWWRYVDSFDLEALDTLLAYNREDVVNLKELKERLL